MHSNGFGRDSRGISSKIAYEPAETNEHIGSLRHQRRPVLKPLLFLFLFSMLVFFLGASVGAYFHAIMYPNGGSPLIELPQFLKTIPVEEDFNSTQVESLLMLNDSSDLSGEKNDYYAAADNFTFSNESNSEYDEDDQMIETILTDSTEITVSLFDLNQTEADNSTIELGNCSLWHNYRLPNYFHPINYRLTIRPNLTTDIVEGNVTITIRVTDVTDVLVLHAENMQMLGYTIQRNAQMVNAQFVPCDIMTQWTWLANETFTIGDEIELSIHYRFTMLSDLQGLYISTHVLSNGTKLKSAATQFEPTFARKMMPCFDEPNYKSNFDVTIIRDARHVTRSNMNLIISREIGNGLFKDEFEQTVNMSTYLLAICVLDGYDYVKMVTKHTREPIEVRLYAPNDVIREKYEFGLTTAVRSLEYFENYFNISYPLKKIDLLALDDFSEGAMENWGLVTFRDSALLYDKAKANVIAQESIALIICHEIAHQWFGNLVTMDWWNEIYLNEGFANYMEYMCVDNLFPEWNIMSRFYVENVAMSQNLDAHVSSRAIDSSDNNNLINLFDAINYHKAAAIIHMIADVVGNENFEKSLVEYLKMYSYRNARGTDLWKIVDRHLDSQTIISIPQLATSFITQVGYPVIDVRRENETIHVQNMGRLIFTDNKQNVRNDTWPLPIRYTLSSVNKTSSLKWLIENDTWYISDDFDWIIVNSGGVGYFKVKYDDETYHNLGMQLMRDYTKISAIDRSMLINDAFDLARTSMLNISTFLDLVSYATRETEKMTWSVINKSLRTIEQLIEDTDFVHIFRDFERSLILNIYESFPWDIVTDSTPSARGLKVEITNNACRLRIHDCVKKAMTRFRKWAGTGDLFPEYQGIILAEGVRQAGRSAWDKIWSRYEETTNPIDRIHIINALSTTLDPHLINRLLKNCVNGKIKTNLIPRVFSGLSSNSSSRTIAWKFFKQHFDRFYELFGTGSSLFVSCIRCLTENLSTLDELNELKDFFKDEQLNGEQFRSELIFEEIELNIQWRRLNEDELFKWIKSWEDRHRTLYR